MQNPENFSNDGNSEQPAEASINPDSEHHFRAEERGQYETYEAPDFIFNIGELGISQMAEKDEQELWDFAKSSNSEALRKNLSGQQVNVVEYSLDRHEEEFGPNKLKQIEEDAQKWIEQLAENLRKNGNENLELVEKIESDANFRLWLSDQYQLRRLTKITETKPVDNRSDFTSEESGRIKESAFVQIEEMRPEECYQFGWVRDRKAAEKILANLRTKIEEGTIDFEKLDESSRKLYNELMGKAEKQERMQDPFREIERRLLKVQGQLVAEGFTEDADKLQEAITRVRNKTFFGEDNVDIPLWESSYVPKEVEKFGWGKFVDKFKNFLGGASNSPEQGVNPFKLTPEAQMTSWEPSEKARGIIIKAIGGFDLEKNPQGGSTSMGKTDIEYWIDEQFTANVEFHVTQQEGYSRAYISIWPPPFNKIKNKLSK